MALQAIRSAALELPGENWLYRQELNLRYIRAYSAIGAAPLPSGLRYKPMITPKRNGSTLFYRILLWGLRF